MGKRAEETRAALVELVASTGRESWWPNAADPAILAYHRKRAATILDALAGKGVVSACMCDRSGVGFWAFCPVHGISKEDMAERVRTAEHDAWEAVKARVAKADAEADRLRALVRDAADVLDGYFPSDEPSAYAAYLRTEADRRG